uniref:Uncharacterized protein n=1 Tax=Fervidobacterium nodosum TaxID=2424 RepID=A0A7C5Y8X9_9BACT
MRVYFDPNFSFNELIDYYAPVIIEINNQKYIDLHSLTIVNLLGVHPKFKGLEKLEDMLLTILEFDDIDIPKEYLTEFTEGTFEKYKISNTISLRQMYQSSLAHPNLLKLENTPNNIEFLVYLCSQYIIENRQYFQDKRFEIILEMIAYIELKKFSERTQITFSMPQPFIFLFDLSNVTLERTHLLLDEIEHLNSVLTQKVPSIYEYCKDKMHSLEKLFESIDRKSFSRLISIFASIDDIISDLLSLKNMLEEIEKIQ